MNNEISFNDQDISDFCTITGDDNELHNPDIMRNEHELPPIVPGMLIFCYAANTAKEFLMEREESKCAKQAEIYFGSVLFSEERAMIGSEIDRDSPLREVKLSAQLEDGKDVLCSGRNHSRLCKPLVQYPITFESNASGSYKLDKEHIERFGEIIRLRGINAEKDTDTNAEQDKEDSDIAGFLFAVAYSSHALIRVMQNQTHIRELLSTDNLPVYDSLTISLEKVQAIDPNFPLEFRLRGEQSGKRDYKFHIACIQNQDTLYKGRYVLKNIPKRILFRTIRTRARSAMLYEPA